MNLIKVLEDYKVKTMYTNELLEEKYKAQKQLFKKAKIEKKDYFEIVNQEVQDLFKLKGWKIEFNKKKTTNIKIWER
ncbi:MAG: hypothetical protein B6I26_06735 [Desulfobacteraceae bacterium 4572_130]|nr:MAG: hypothetical protein B6I26_06735 [Desulfobacteraceae bacterium 4572_130]